MADVRYFYGKIEHRHPHGRPDGCWCSPLPPDDPPQPCQPTMNLLEPEVRGWLDEDELDERVVQVVVRFMAGFMVGFMIGWWLCLLLA